MPHNTTQHTTPKHNKVTHNNTKQHNPHETKMKILVSDKITENAGTEYNERLLRWWKKIIGLQKWKIARTQPENRKLIHEVHIGQK